MSSIAYVTDQKMIEYHRLNGNRSLNFWRPSAAIRFSDFHNGDLLFFLAKGTEKTSRDTKEKGIVGYGKYIDGEVLPPSIAWKRYQTKNGYQSKESFFDAVAKVSKDRELPETISCLHLENVVFFQAPIYLSELGINLSSKVESYIYLDKDDDTITLQILEKAKDVGIDIWSLSFDDYEENDVFETVQKRELIAKISSFLVDKKVSDREERQLNKIATSFIVQNDEQDIDYIKGTKNELYQITNDTIHIYVPLIFNSQDKNQRIQTLIGKLLSYKALLEIDPFSSSIIKLHALVPDTLEEGLALWIKQAGIIIEKVTL